MFARFSSCALVALISLCCLVAAYGQPAPAEPSGLVVLRNGQVLAGRAALVGDKYAVELAGGSEIRIAATDVEMVCRDLLEAYQTKHKALPPQNATAQLDLAEWCLRHDLHAQAAEQLLEVMAYAPENKRMAQVEERLRAAAHRTAPAEAAPVVTGPSTEQLEQTMRSLAPATLEHFVNTVQPLLLNRCAASGCHGSSATSTFKLMRPGVGISLTRRTTQQNLFAILPLVDRTNPEKSVLLTATEGPHGTAKAAIFTEHEQKLREQLADFVRRVAKPEAFPTQVQQASATSETTAAKRATMKALFERYQSTGNDADFNREAKRNALLEGHRPLPNHPGPPGVQQPGPNNAAKPAAPGSLPVPPATTAQPPADPQDPEAFNREFLGGANSAPAEPAK